VLLWRFARPCLGCSQQPRLLQAPVDAQVRTHGWCGQASGVSRCSGGSWRNGLSAAAAASITMGVAGITHTLLVVLQLREDALTSHRGRQAAALAGEAATGRAAARRSAAVGIGTAAAAASRQEATGGGRHEGAQQPAKPQ
jgi:hypothetical protein